MTTKFGGTAYAFNYFFSNVAGASSRYNLVENGWDTLSDTQSAIGAR